MTEYKREKPERMCDGVLEIKDMNQWTAEHHLAEAYENIKNIAANLTETEFNKYGKYLNKVSRNILKAWDKSK